VNPTPFGAQSGIRIPVHRRGRGAGYVWGAGARRRHRGVLKEILQSYLPFVFGEGQLETIVFGLLLVTLLQMRLPVSGRGSRSCGRSPRHASDPGRPGPFRSEATRTTPARRCCGWKAHASSSAA